MTSIGSPSPFFLAGKKAYEIERSLRFNKPDIAYFQRTPSSASNRKTFTWSGWVKRGNSVYGNLFTCGTIGGNPRTEWIFDNNDTMKIGFNPTGSSWIYAETSRVFRDSSAWYHFVLAVDTTQSTSTDRVKLYVNGELQTFSSYSAISQNTDLPINSTIPHQIGAYAGSTNSNGENLDGYMAEVNFIDGQAYDSSYFGEINAITGQWNPKKYVGSYGTNGFYLNFSDNSGTTATTLGKDSSGNGNNFTPNNLAVSDAVKDSPTNNFATLDVLAESGGTYSEGNLKVVGTSDPSSSTIGFASGKFYYEAYIDATSNIYVSVIPVDFGLNPARGGNWTHGAIAYRVSGQQYKLKAGGGYSSVSASYGASYTAGDIIGCAVDIDNDTVTFYKNGVSQGNTSDGVSYITASGTTSIYGAMVYCNGGNNTFRVNFGQDSTFQGTVSAGGNTDANGIGDFKYTVPTGYKALCSANLPDPTIKLPNKHFDTKLYTGNGSTGQTITYNFGPDFVWMKNRDAGNNHAAVNTVVGRAKGLYPDSNSGEFNSSAGRDVSAFTSNGFTVGEPEQASSTNNNGSSIVAWAWNAGDTDGKTYTVKVHDFSGNSRYIFDDFQTQAVTLDLAEGGTYIFNMDDSSNASHPFSIGTSANGTVYTSGITYFLDGVSKTYNEYTSGFAAATTRRLHITVPASAPVLYYWCSVHSGMGGQVNTNSTLGSSNFDGSLQATVKANASSGFSIGLFTGTGSNGSIGHGLGVAPSVVIAKSRSHSDNWFIYHKSLGANAYIMLNSTDAADTNNSTVWQNVSPTSSVFYASTGGYNDSGQNLVFYAFSEVAGYSKFGSYTGNGSTDGTFVYTGFRPAWVMVKRTDASNDWPISDNKRSSFNLVDKALYADLTNSESTANRYDFLSNGFKIRNNLNESNASGGTYIYLAFAESPFKNARAR